MRGSSTIGLRRQENGQPDEKPPHLVIEGAWHGAVDETQRKRRTSIIGDLSLKSYGTSPGNIITEGILQAKDVEINSSQELKQDISTLTKEEAYSLLEDLEPVKFAFRDDPSKRENIGFIAEDVPDIVSDKDHKSVRYMEIISVLTKVVKEQEKKINELQKEYKNHNHEFNHVHLMWINGARREDKCTDWEYPPLIDGATRRDSTTKPKQVS